MELLALAVRAASTAAPLTINYNARGILLAVYVTANPGGGETLTPQIRTSDVTTGNEGPLWGAAVAINGNGRYNYLLYPGIGAAADGINDTSDFILPRRWQAYFTHSAAGNWTYSCGAEVLV